MTEKIIFAMVFGMFIYFCVLVYKRYRAQPNALTTQELKLKQEILETFKKATDLEIFLKNAQYFEQIAIVKEQAVYKYIYNNGYLYEFKDFLSRDKKIFLMNEEALSYNYMYYERKTPSPEFVNKYLVGTVKTNEPKHEEKTSAESAQEKITAETNIKVQ